MNIEDILQSLPSREDISNAMNRYNTRTSNWMSSSSNDNMDLLPVLGIFGTGMLLGAGLAMLFAPKSGSELRQDIADKMSEYGGQARDLAEQGRQMASQAGEQVRQMSGQYGSEQHGQGQMSQSGGSSQSGGIGGSASSQSQSGSSQPGGSTFNRTR